MASLLTLIGRNATVVIKPILNMIHENYKFVFCQLVSIIIMNISKPHNATASTTMINDYIIVVILKSSSFSKFLSFIFLLTSLLNQLENILS